MKIPLRKALWLAVGPANVDAAGHAVADWFDGHNCSGAADLIREHLQDQPEGDAVPHNRPDTSLRAELLQKLATQREVLLSLCDRVDRLETRADGLTPIERVQRRWAKERSVKESLTVGGNGPAVSEDREPASVVGEPTDLAELVAWLRENVEDERQMCGSNGQASRNLDRTAELLERLASPACVVLKPSPELIEAFEGLPPGRIEPLPDNAQVIEPSNRTILVPAPVPVPVSERLPVDVEQALIKAECALSDIAEGEPEENEGDADALLQWAEQRAATALSRIRPVMRGDEPELPNGSELPDGYIDPGHSAADREMLEAFYLAARSEGGTTDEITLRGIRAATRAAELLQQRHAEPVPVSKRLPGPEDCDENGYCWRWNTIAGVWSRQHFARHWYEFESHWLPATALPLPAGEVQE